MATVLFEYVRLYLRWQVHHESLLSLRVHSNIAVSSMAPLRFLSLAGALFFTSTQATPYNRHSSPDSNCIDATIPISVTAEAIKVLIPPFENGYQATHFISQATNRNANGDLSSLLGSKYNITETFPIPFTYCKSSKPGPKSDIVQVLSHGLGFDRR